MKITEKESFTNKKFLTIEEGITRDDIIIEGFQEPIESHLGGTVHSQCRITLKQPVVDRLYELFEFRTYYTDVFGLYVVQQRDTDVISMTTVVRAEVPLRLQGVRKDKQQAKIDALKTEVQTMINDEEFVNSKIDTVLNEINSAIAKRVDSDNDQTLRDSLSRVKDTSLTKWTDSGSQTIASMKGEIEHYRELISDIQEKIRQERSQRLEKYLDTDGHLYDEKMVEEVQTLINDDEVFSNTGFFGHGY